MRRFVGAALAGLGGLLLVVAVGLPLFVAPAVAKLPYTLAPCPPPPAAAPDGCLKPTVAEASNAQVLLINAKGVNVITANLRTTVEVLPQVKLTADQQDAGKLDKNAVIWAVYQTTTIQETGEGVSSTSTELALDRTSAEAVNWSGQWIEDQNSPIQYSGLTYKFPFGTQQRDYKIYDTDVRAASTAKFQSVENVNGVEVYHFVQQIPDTNVTVAADSMAALLDRFAPDAKTGTVSYRNTREVWVDPVTGAFINVRERPHQELHTDTGQTQVLLDADFTYTKDTVANSAASAKANASQLKLVTLYGPIGLGVLGLVLVVVGVLLARAPRPTTPTGAWDETLPEPRHSLRGEPGYRAADDEAPSNAR